MFHLELLAEILHKFPIFFCFRPTGFKKCFTRYSLKMSQLNHFRESSMDCFKNCSMNFFRIRLVIPSKILCEIVLKYYWKNHFKIMHLICLEIHQKIIHVFLQKDFKKICLWRFLCEILRKFFHWFFYTTFGFHENFLKVFRKKTQKLI